MTGVVSFEIFVTTTLEKQLKAPLQKRGILIRACGNFQGLDDSFYRVCVMEHEQNAELITAIKEVLHG